MKHLSILSQIDHEYSHSIPEDRVSMAVTSRPAVFWVDFAVAARFKGRRSLHHDPNRVTTENSVLFHVEHFRPDSRGRRPDLEHRHVEAENTSGARP
jgi:hypothetical protein